MNLEMAECVLAWTETLFSKTLEPLENDDVMIILQFSCPGLPQTQIQRDRQWLRFQIFPTKVDEGLVSLCGRRGIKYQQVLKGLVLVVNCATKQSVI